MSPDMQKASVRAAVAGAQPEANWFTELTMTLPRQLFRLICDVRKEVERCVEALNTPQIGVPPMSKDWLRRYESARARRQDL